MKLLIIGTILVVYAIFLSPCFIEPADVIISTGYIILAMSMGIDPIWILLWIVSGYVALFIGLSFIITGTIIHIKHPLLIFGIALLICIMVGYWLFAVSGLV